MILNLSITDIYPLEMSFLKGDSKGAKFPNHSPSVNVASIVL